MRTISSLLRVAVGFFGAVLLSGVVWSGSAMNTITLIAGVVAGVVSLSMAAIPDHFQRGAAVTAVLLAGLSVLALMLQCAGHQGAKEWDVLLFQFLHLSVLVAIGWRLCFRSAARSEGSTSENRGRKM